VHGSRSLRDIVGANVFLHGHGCRFQADEGPERQGCRSGDAGQDSVGSEGREVLTFHEEKADHADDSQGHELQDRRHELDLAALADIEDVGEGERQMAAMPTREASRPLLPRAGQKTAK
jgi:hypothetical protein